MSDDKLEDLPILGEMGSDLRAAATRVDRRGSARLRPSAAVIVVAALAIVAVVLLVASPGGSRLDPVAQAQAALSPEDTVLHMVLRGGILQPDGSPVETLLVGERGRRLGIERRHERWVASNPVRTRSEIPVRTPDGTPAGVISSGSGAGGTRWSRSPGGHVRTSSAELIATLERQADALASGESPRDVRRDPIRGAVRGDEDPTVVLRRLFDAGRFRPGAERVRDGRKVRDLVASERGQQRDNGSVRPYTRTIYTVDAESFAPVEIRRYVRFPGDGELKLRSHTVIETFERLDPDDLPAEFFDVP